jgi:hypothetical protein
VPCGLQGSSKDGDRAVKEQTLIDINNELMHARNEFPMPNPTFAALIEEVGELAQALLKCQIGFAHRGSRAVYDEAKQVAVMAIRIMEEGDQFFMAYTPELLHLDRDLAR